MSVSQSSHETSWVLYRSQSCTDFQQTCHQGRVPGDVVNYWFWWKSERCVSAKLEVKLIFTIVPMENSFNVKYLENGDRYYDGVNESQIWNHPWAIDWHHDFWPWMTLNCSRSRSQNLHIKYLECRDRYNVGHNGGHIENHQWASDWHHDIWY